MGNEIHEKLEDIKGTPLYHHTSEERALSILKQNKLRGSLPGDDYLEFDNRVKNSPDQSVVSFTRDKNFIPGLSIGSSLEHPKDLNVILVLDRDKLRTRYKIEPFNYFSMDPDFKKVPYKKNDELEERVLSKYIYPLDKYLTKIIYKGNNTKFKKELEKISKDKTKGATGNESSGTLSDPLFSGEEPKSVNEQFYKEFLDKIIKIPEYLSLIIKIYNGSKYKSKIEFSTDDVKRDAYRHILASALFTKMIGPKLTLSLGTANEVLGALKNLFLKGEFDSGWVMDEKNNKIGIDFALKNLDKGQDFFEKSIKKIVSDGNFFDEAGKLYSNNISRKKETKQDLIKEQEKLDKIPKVAIKLFKYIDDLRAKNPNYKLKKQIEDVISRTLEIMGMDTGLSKYYTELYFANKSKDKKYEDLGPEDIVDPRRLRGKTTTNPDSFKYTKGLLPFRGSNLSGQWETDKLGVDVYVVLSYRWYPIFLYKEGRWYSVVDNYSASTARQIYNSDPTQLSSKWDRDLNVSVYLVTPKEMDALRRGAKHQDIIEGKLKNLIGSKELLKKKRAQFSKTYGPYSWPIRDDNEPETKIKFKIKDLFEKDDKIVFEVDIQDVKRRSGQMGLNTPENYLKGELLGITKEKVESAVKKTLLQNFKEFIGPRILDFEKDPENMLIDFKFNHVKKT